MRWHLIQDCTVPYIACVVAYTRNFYTCARPYLVMSNLISSLMFWFPVMYYVIYSYSIYSTYNIEDVSKRNCYIYIYIGLYYKHGS